MFTPEEKEILNKYVTSTDANIFAIRGMNGMAGAAYARYSRAKGGFREVLLKEFIEGGNIDPVHADELIQRVLIAYGDDSVGELEGAHVSFEQITMLAAKEIEDRRIGGSPIEQSTRYVLYDQKNEDGNWKYYRGKEILESSYGKQYAETMDFIFGVYSDLIEPMRSHLESQKPLAEAEYDINGDGVKEKLADLTDEKLIKSFKQTYTFELRAKACDILRSLLPIATLTNVGMFGNGRFYQGLVSYLITTDLPENHAVAAGVQDALKEIIPQYIRRAQRSDYTAANSKNMFSLAAEVLKNHVSELPDLPYYMLMDRGEGFLEKRIRHEGVSAAEALNEWEEISMLAAMLYPYTSVSLHDLRKMVDHMDRAERSRIAHTYIGDRKTRRDRPGRALEDGYPYMFDMITTFGTYKDLQRHRMNTQNRQLFTTTLGFSYAPELDAIPGALEKVKACVEKAHALYETIVKESPLLAQYAPLHGHYIRWSMGFNDREAMHMLELRSTPQGHPSYRFAAQQMHKLIEARNERKSGAMKFVDHNDYYWSRADSEAKQRVKEAALDKKLGSGE
jgi:thymidylate synthase ThyX